MKEAIKKYFANFRYKAGDVEARSEIYSAYNALWEEMPSVQYVREADGYMDKHAEIMLKCLQKGEPYRMSKKDASEIAKLDAEGVPHDGF